MATFILGLVILLVGGALYGRLCERAFGPDDRTTPAIEKADAARASSMRLRAAGILADTEKIISELFE